MKTPLLYTLFCIIFKLCSYAQLTDSTSIRQEKKKAIYTSARKAATMSAIFPGLGQIYNKKYWKAPIIYLALGGISYLAIDNQKQYKFYSDNLYNANDNDSTTTNIIPYRNDELISEKRRFRKNRDLAIMLGALVYFLNIIDANVDAHLKTFDVSDDLSLQIGPYTNLIYNNQLQTGLTFKLRFK